MSAMPTTDEYRAALAASPDGVKIMDLTAPSNAVEQVGKRKEPPPEKAESIRMRNFVIFSFWAVVLFLGLPVWWRTTSIYRAHLPLSQMNDWADGRVRPSHCLYLVMLTSHRHVVQSSLYEYRSKLIHCNIRKHSICFEQPSMPLMISTTFQGIIYVYSSLNQRIPR